MDNRKFGAITSSTNPEEIANRVKGIVLTFSSVIILLASQVLHLTLTANDVIVLATEIGGVAGAIWTIYGTVLWILATFFKRN